MFFDKKDPRYCQNTTTKPFLQIKWIKKMLDMMTNFSF